jgi:hypothetical protein
MNTLLIFANLIAAAVFVLGGLWVGLTLLTAFIDYMDPDRDDPRAKLQRAIEDFAGIKRSYHVVRRSILPSIAGLWLLAAYLTGNLLP